MSNTTTTRSGRAAPLSPPERREAILDATLPLLRSEGLSVTTKQIAHAAGVAEGTIFRVFADKDELLQAAVVRGLDPQPTTDSLAEIDLDQPLERRLEAAVAIMQGHMSDTWRLIAAVGPDGMPRLSRQGKRMEMFDLDVLTRLFSQDEVSVRRAPAAAAQALIGLTLAGSHPMIVGDQPISPNEIVTLLLDGIRRRADQPAPETGDRS